MRRKKYVLAAALAAAVTLACQLPVWAAGGKAADLSRQEENVGPGTVEKSDPVALTAELGFDPGSLQGVEDADQLLVAVGTGGCGAEVFYCRRTEDESWELVWKEDAVAGRSGISAEKQEGDGRTPAGTYRFTMAFGLLDDPGSVLAYHKVTAGDVWVDDPDSPYYNQMVLAGQTDRNWKSAEGLAGASPYYNYVLALNYNEECVPGKGSAIFLHCFTASPDNGSAGCVRLPEERMKELLLSVTEKSRIVIAPDLSSLQT